MRKALNENPMVQITVIAVIGIAFAILMFTTVLKGKSGADAAPAPAAATSPPVAGSVPDPVADGATAAPPVAAADPAVASTLPPPTSSVDPNAGAGLLPTKGLPEDLLVAYARDKAIALLVVDPNSSAGPKMSEYTRRLASPGVEVFIVDSKDIADYSRITSGVEVSQTPALVVIRPRKLTGSVPTASVSYGFRGPKSVRQALDDGLYDGGQVTAYP